MTRFGPTLRLGLAATASVAALALGAQAGAVPIASKIVDRTLSCETGLTGGIHKISIVSSSANPQSTTPSAGEVELTSNLQPSVRLVWLAQTGVELSVGCTAIKAAVPLASKGLTGGPVGPIEEHLDCQSTRRVLVHVHALFRSPVILRRGRPYGFPLLYAHSAVSSGSLAVRTTSGKPLLYSAVFPTGKVKTFGSLPLSCTD